MNLGVSQGFAEGNVDGMQHVPVERVRNSFVEQIGGVPAPQIWEPFVEGGGADCGSPCAADHQKKDRGRCAAGATGARAESYSGAGR